jgi:hypothetical protein
MAAAVILMAAKGFAQDAKEPKAGDKPAADKPATEKPAAEKLSSQQLADWIDARFAKQYAEAGVEGGPTVDDATYLRRIYLDLQGRIPTVAQIRDFLAEEKSDKRGEHVERLLNDDARPERYSQRSADHLARVWRRMMVPASAPGAGMAPQLEPWLSKQFAANLPYDQFARKLVLVNMQNPQTRFLSGLTPPKEPMEPDPDADAGIFQAAIGGAPENLAAGYTRVFLGMRINCAQCHDHPFTEWKQKDFWGVAAIFSGDPAKQAEARPAPTITPADGANVTYQAKLLWTKDPIKEIPADRSPRELLADWLVSPENPNFAATAVNRTWQYLCGRGLAGSVDELDRITPQEREVLDDMAKLFVQSGYDFRWLVTGICKSKTYQQVMATEPTTGSGWVHRPLKTLLPEQVFDSLERALNLPVAKVDGGPRFNGEKETFVARMNEAAGELPSDYKGGIPQALMLMNGKLTADATSQDASRTLRAVVEAPFLGEEAKLEALYMATLSRKPSERELEYLRKHVEDRQETALQRQAYAEIMWGLLNSPEFVLSR